LDFSANLVDIMSRRFLFSILSAALVSLPAAQVSAQQTNSLPPAPATTSANPPTVPVAVATNPASATPVASPSIQPPANERSSYSSIRVDGPYIAMTFDDGPDPKLTPKLLDTLKERHIHATFFVVGKMVQDHPEILQRAIAEGHEVGNHTWDHLPLTKVVQKEGGLDHEIADTSALIKQTIGHAPSIMRPPYGATNARLSKAIEKQYGMKVILWSVDPFDWKDPGASVVQNRILNGWKGSGGAKPGAIILSHDIHKGTVEAMPATLDALLAKGYKFVTVSELLELESKNPAPSPTPSASKATKTKRRKQS